MRIQGLQKLTLLDFPDKMAATVFTGGCNFRCPFCHNASLVTGKPEQGISDEELFHFLEKRKGILEGVCVTGGEPLLHAEIKELVKKIKDLGFLVKLDTNGSFPDRLEDLIESHLVDYVAMDIKNSREHYGRTVGIENFDCRPIEESAAMLMKGILPFEFRTTVVAELHTAQDFVSIGNWLKGKEAYFLQHFVDSGDLIEQGLHGCDSEKMTEYCGVLSSMIPKTAVRGI